MEELKLQKNSDNNLNEAQQVVMQPQKDASNLLKNFGGFLAIKDIIPASEDMNPTKKAVKESFLKDSRKANKREALAAELKGWIELLDSGDLTVTELVDKCKEKEDKYQSLLEQGVTKALAASEKLEKAYRSLDAFFKNSGTEKVEKLRIVNIKKEAITDPNSDFSSKIDELLKKAFDRLSLRDSYSIMVIPGGIFKNRVELLKWAKIAFKYKVILVTDTPLDQEDSLDDLREYTRGFADSDQCLQNVVMACNWLVGRESEMLSGDEKYKEAFYISPAGALAGMMYDESVVISQGRAGEKYGTVSDVKGVKLDILKTEIGSLQDSHVVPMVFSEGRVMAFNNNTLYKGDLDSMQEYPIVRVFDWIKKVLMNFVHQIALENWDPYVSPKKLKEKIQDFLNQYQGYQNFFQSYKLGEPKQDPKTKVVSVDISIKPYYAAKNFIIKLEANNKDVEANMENEK